MLKLTGQRPCSAYDCEFVALARSLGVRPFTLDRKVMTASPDIAISLEAFGPAAS